MKISIEKRELATYIKENLCDVFFNMGAFNLDQENQISLIATVIPAFLAEVAVNFFEDEFQSEYIERTCREAKKVLQCHIEEKDKS